MKITKLQRAPEGHWTARVGGTPVTRQFGSWGTIPNDDGCWHDLPTDVAARIQDKVRPIEKAEKRATKEAVTA